MKKKALIIIRILEMLTAILFGYTLVFFELLNRGQGGHGDGPLLLLFIYAVMSFYLANLAFCLGPKGRSFVRSFLDYVCEISIVAITSWLIYVILSWQSLGILKSHFCSEKKLKIHDLSMLPCRCGVKECGG